MAVNTLERSPTENLLHITEASFRHIQIDHDFSILLHRKPSVVVQLPDSKNPVVCAYESEGPDHMGRFTVTNSDNESFNRLYFYYYPNLQFDILGLTGEPIPAKAVVALTKDPELYTSAEIGHVNTVMMNPRGHAHTLAHWLGQITRDGELFRVIP